MKFRLLSALLCSALIFSLFVCASRLFYKSEEAPTSSTTAPESSKNKADKPLTKAIWISQFDMSAIYTEGGVQRERSDYERRTSALVDNLCKIGINTVFFQLRPNGDSIYPSQIFPASKYAVETYGNEFSYDPFGIFLELARERSISVHGWINPMRCMRENEISQIPNKYIIKAWYENHLPYIKSVEGVLYLDPAYEEVRALISEGVCEILSRYELDGIHIDDYFYPTTSPDFDIESYSKYLDDGGRLSLADFRRENVNTMIKEIYDTVKKKDISLLFGVSPAGNNDRNYNELYADVKAWCENGYLDYLCPQIYFGTEHQSYPFDEVCREFYELCQASDTDIIIGITLGKAYDAYSGGEDRWAGSGAREWIENKDVILRSLELARGVGDIDGIALFSYRLIFDPLSAEQIPETAEECACFLPYFKAI